MRKMFSGYCLLIGHRIFLIRGSSNYSYSPFKHIHETLQICFYLINCENYILCRIIYSAELYTLQNYILCRIIFAAELSFTSVTWNYVDNQFKYNSVTRDGSFSFFLKTIVSNYENDAEKTKNKTIVFKTNVF